MAFWVDFSIRYVTESTEIDFCMILLPKNCVILPMIFLTSKNCFTGLCSYEASRLVICQFSQNKLVNYYSWTRGPQFCGWFCSKTLLFHKFYCLKSQFFCFEIFALLAVWWARDDRYLYTTWLSMVKFK